MTRDEYVARSLWESCQRATGMTVKDQPIEPWENLPAEPRQFWMIEARALLHNLERIEG